MKQPFEDYGDLHQFRMANCEGCDRWSCLSECKIWKAFREAVRSSKPIPEQALIDSGYTEGKEVWPCAQFKDYGYIGFVPGIGKKKED